MLSPLIFHSLIQSIKVSSYNMTSEVSFINKKAQDKLSFEKLGMPVCIKNTLSREIYSKGVLSH